MSKHIAEGLQSLIVPLDSLTPDPANVRKHSERNLQAIRSSMQRFGQRVPLVVQKQGMLIRAGNARYYVAKELGWSEMAALVIEEDDLNATAYAIADNRTAELADWDNQALIDIVDSLDVDKDVIGFSDEEIQELVDNITQANEEQWSEATGWDGEHSDYTQMSFNLDNGQLEVVKEAVAKSRGDCDGDTNINAQAITAICRHYLNER